MSKGFEGTPGPWFVSDESVITRSGVDGDIVAMNPGELGWYDSARYWAENAPLIAEAGTVLHETGLTPRQLAESRAELLADAERYRWLRKNNGVLNHQGVEVFIGGESHAPGHLDAQVDEAMEADHFNATQQRNATGGEG